MKSFYDLIPLFTDVGYAKEYLLSMGVFYDEMNCSKCGQVMTKSIPRWKFSCWARSCRVEMSLYSYTFFSGSKLSANQILLLAKLWLDKASVDTAMSFTGHSSHTVSIFWKHFRQLVASSLDIEDTVIGGPGIVVQVDETKLGRRKYHRGHRVEGVWVVVGVELTDLRKVFIVPVEKRDASSLREIITTHVVPGSIIQSDCWRGYDWLNTNIDFVHQTVNHSIGFIDVDTGVHTNVVEGTNSGIKRRISIRNRVKNGIEGHLDEFIWRRKNEARDLWDCFLECLRDVHYDIQ